MKRIKKQLWILDFCGTLVKFQTKEEFIKLIIKRNNSKKVLFIFYKSLNFFINVINKIFRTRFKVVDLSILLIKENKKNIERYSDIYLNKLLSEANKIFLDQIRLKKEVDIIIISGGMEIYISKFLEGFKIKKIFASKIIYNKENTFERYDKIYLGNNKVVAYKTYIKDKLYDKIYFFTDSYSDIDLIRSKQINLVAINPNKKLKKFCDYNDIKSFGFNERVSIDE